MTPGGPGTPSETPSETRVAAQVAGSESGTRLDVWLGARLPSLSRTRIKGLVESGHVTVDGRQAKAGYRLKAAERVEARVPPLPPETLAPEPIALDVVFEDGDVLVVDKPAGMVTHPGAGRTEGTLAAAALAHAPEMAGVGGPRRPGIVHRLDKGTSGLIMLAKTQRAYDALTAALARRAVKRRYVCLVEGAVRRERGIVDAPIGRDPRSRVRMAIAPEGKGKRAVTRFRVVERLAGATLLQCDLETGRTHQIRVHVASIGHPIVGDQTYGRRASAVSADLVAGLGGVALHAAGLSFVHPVTGVPIDLMSPVPYRMGRILSHLRCSPR